MPSTNKTPTAALSQFIATDIPKWLQDYNTDMSRIDTFLRQNQESIEAVGAEYNIALSIANNTYSGRSLATLFSNEISGAPYFGNVWAWVRNRAQTGNFTGLSVGDYIDITISGTYYDAAVSVDKTITNTLFRMEIAGMDSYYQYSDTAIPHHIDFISKDCIADSFMYNPTATNNGAYLGSSLFTTLNGINGIQKLLPTDVSAVILNKRGLSERKTSTTSSSWAWGDMGKIWLPTEQEVWGHIIWAEHRYGGGIAIQYPIFKNSLRHIIKGFGNGGARCSWWCASTLELSNSQFCDVFSAGHPGDASAIQTKVSVPICFRVA